MDKKASPADHLTYYEQFEALHQALVNCWEAIAEASPFREVIEMLDNWVGRAELWLADKWPTQ